MLLKQGPVLIDRHDPAEIPRLLVAVTQEITDGHDPARTISKRFDYAEISPGGSDGAQAPHGVRATGEARYLDYDPPDDPERAVALRLREDPWLSSGVEALALDWAVTKGMPAELARTRDLVTARVDQVRRLVKQRLTHEINYWDMRHAELLEAESVGKQLKLRPQTAHDRARDLERRLERRLADLALDEELIARPPVVSGGALVVPQGLLDRLFGPIPRPPLPPPHTPLTQPPPVAPVLPPHHPL